MSENGEIYIAGKNFTLPPAVTGVTNSTSEYINNQLTASLGGVRDGGRVGLNIVFSCSQIGLGR